ncbi:MAG TPA: hypothetical protein VKY19_21505 [Ktedonosporobacter sp.]|jgi:hypothetical protein|nr:hypothetical protein [Ktedonosporobacter sp.]
MKFDNKLLANECVHVHQPVRFSAIPYLGRESHIGEDAASGLLEEGRQVFGQDRR